jgi:UDP-N-acetylmuramoylalanine--D-glutamate ligase
VTGGNIGAALLDLLPGLPADPAQGPVVVAEVSSYQAALVVSPPRIAVLTSLFPDHLPWHGGVERYYADKLRLLTAPGTLGLVNGADANIARLIDGSCPQLAGVTTYGEPGSRVRVGSDAADARGGDDDERGDAAERVVLVDGAPALGLGASRLPGRHNRLNVAAAVAVLDALGVRVAALRPRLEAAIAEFAPLPHRLEPVGEVAGVTFVDDSLATSAQAAVAACEAYPGRPLTLLAGGLDRGIDYAPLAAYLTERAAATSLVVVAMGPAGARLATRLSGVAVERTDDVADAVRLAAKLTPAGGVALFSPAAPSPTAYGNYEQRSAVFTETVRELERNRSVRDALH